MFACEKSLSYGVENEKVRISGIKHYHKQFNERVRSQRFLPWNFGACGAGSLKHIASSV